MKLSKYSLKKFFLIMSLAFCSLELDAQLKGDLLVEDKLKNLESSTKGRLGIFAINTENGDIIEYRADESFPMGCTSKVIGVSAVLKRSMSDPLLLSKKTYYSKDELAFWSPVTEKYVAEGMTVQALCAAAISFSDNTAMNMLLKTINGIEGMNEFARSIGDYTFSQDHDWPLEAYSGGANNKEDTSSPKSMVESLYKLTLGNVLDKPQQELLITWLIETNTGAARIRSGVPNGWVVGNKTGTGAEYGSTNDLAIIWPLQHKPLLIGVYYTSDDKKAIKREDIVSSATKLIIAEFTKRDKRLEVKNS